MRAWVESEATHATVRRGNWVNVLQKFSLVLEHARILELGAVLQPANIATEHAGSASGQTTHENVLVLYGLLMQHDVLPCLSFLVSRSKVSSSLEVLFPPTIVGYPNTVSPYTSPTVRPRPSGGKSAALFPNLDFFHPQKNFVPKSD